MIVQQGTYLKLACIARVLKTTPIYSGHFVNFIRWAKPI